MGIDKKLNIKIGDLSSGKNNLITDVAGVEVGHKTIDDGEIQTGVTAIFPHKNNLFKNKVMASCHVINGFGKSVGLVQIEELGNIETPIVLTNTLSVGVASTALTRYMLKENEDIGTTTGTVNPIIGECNDGFLNNIRAMAVTENDVKEALNNTSSIFEEGSVGAGRAMRCHGLKGGIGSASRVVELNSEKYTIGALLLANHGRFPNLEINGKNISKEVEKQIHGEDKGSVIIVLATDIPLSSRQLKRLCKRAVIGLGRVGSFVGNGSGDIAIAFSTANIIKHYPENDFEQIKSVVDGKMDQLFIAIIEAVQESILSAMLHAKPIVGFQERRLDTLSEILKKIKI
ncbi:MAG: P1 family peptidase [Campylobacteraceae bacterium]